MNFAPNTRLIEGPVCYTVTARKNDRIYLSDGVLGHARPIRDVTRALLEERMFLSATGKAARPLTDEERTALAESIPDTETGTLVDRPLRQESEDACAAH